MKAPDDEEDEDHLESGWSEEDLKSVYHRKELRDFVVQDPVMRILKLKRIADPKDPVTAPVTLANRFDAAMEVIGLLKEAGMAPGSFDTDALFDLDLNVIQATSPDLIQKLKFLVGEVPQSPDPLPSTTTDAVDNLTVSSHYASAAEDGSDTSSEPPRQMSLEPSGESMLEARFKICRSSPARSSRRDNRTAPTDQATATESSNRSVGTLKKFFNAAMDRYLAEEREANKDPATTQPQHQGAQDVEMESIRSSDRGSHWEYDPDDVDFPTSAQATVATAAAGSANHEVTSEIKRTSKISEYRRPTTKGLLPGEFRGYWKHHSPGKWFRQAKITGKIHNEKSILLLDTGAEVSIVGTTFARKVGCYIDSSQIQDCVGIGDNVYRTEDQGDSCYISSIWVGDLTGQQAILSMDFMVPARIRLDLAHGTISFADEVRIRLSGSRQLYSDKAKIVNSTHDKLWVTRGDRWVPTISDGPGRTKYTSLTIVGNEVLILHQDQRIGIWLTGDHVPRLPGFISIGSRRYIEWQNLALVGTTDARSEDMGIEAPLEPAVERAEYQTPRTILQRPKTTSIKCRKVEASQDQDIPDCLPSDNSPSDKSASDIRPLDLASVASEESDLSSIADGYYISHTVTVKEVLEDLDQITPDVWTIDPSSEETTSAVET
ncbi:hypothetical protein PHMEG_00014356 [Phytophthora megakarya]|uniref:Peptidase A2 domain-containing protein n=1 Tax=Phytophthora megakarya TaxID=4795 RepID=A0A225W5J6_9STRA|nr:hypothetical protein PHMEG_00014356 [Phytophthora megakarya]